MTFDLFVLFLLFQAGLPGLVVSAVVASPEKASTVISVPQNDPELLAATRKAQAGLDDFLAKLDNPSPDTTAYAVKIGIADRGDGFVIVRGEHDTYVEYIWVTDITRTATGFVGVIDNDPETVRNIASGQHIAFVREDILDWSYLEGGKIRGNATACPLLRRGSQEELKFSREELGMDC